MAVLRVACCSPADCIPAYAVQFGSYGQGNGQFLQLRDVLVDSDTGNMYAVDSYMAGVQVFDAGGNYIKQLVGFGYGDHQVNEPVAVGVDTTTKNIVVLDAGYRVGNSGARGSIKTFAADGTFLSKFVSTLFVYVYSMAINSARGLIYVGDYGRGDASEPPKILTFTTDGTFVSQFQMVKQDGSSLGLIGPEGLAVDDATGIVFVADYYGTRILKFDADGKFIGEFAGTGDGQISKLFGVEVDSAGRLYLADKFIGSGGRIVKFDLDGVYKGQFGATPDSGGNGQLSNPYAVTADKLGNIYVADGSLNSILTYICPNPSTAGELEL